MEEKSEVSDDSLTEYLVGFGSTRRGNLLGKTPSLKSLKPLKTSFQGMAINLK
jgi:hypothetical protein